MSVVRAQGAAVKAERPGCSVAPDRQAAVYRLFAGDGALLYVGSAYDPEERCMRHRDAAWWLSVVRRTEEWHPTRVHAYHAEMAAITGEAPVHNIMGSATYREECRRRAREDPLHRARIMAGVAAANGAPRNVVNAILRGEVKSYGRRTGVVLFD
ncbi:hypothetical protein [Streptomyces sp. NPDC055912]|uniref:hypothetical protein n=1 Tax=unclassified Streptomyces TaxID=2593676 RepID=UPI0035E00DE3